MKKILIADDEPDIIYVLSRILKKYNFETIEACNRMEVLEILKKEKPDLIILDVMMLHIDGWRVARIIRENPETKDIPIIILTVRDGIEDHEKSFSYSRANAHITKPIIEEKLIATILWVLKTSKRPNFQK